MNNNDLDNAEIWLRQVVKGELADKETVEAIEIVLKVLDRLRTENILLKGFKLKNPNWVKKRIKDGGTR